MSEYHSPQTTNIPPRGLIEAQRIAVQAAEQTVASTCAGETEIDAFRHVETYARSLGAVDFWTPTVVGFGPGSLSCFPTDKPSDRPLWNLDIGHVDVHPITSEGWWGDCTRSIVTGEHPRHHELFKTVNDIHNEVLASLKVGMRACDAFAIFERLLKKTPYRLLDRLENIGHSLDQGDSYSAGYLNRWNENVLSGAWAFEPFIGTDLYGGKVEDVVWFGSDTCTILR
ncbi:MAG: M24 family metallopeptidase [Bifidobacterium tibiigranuli]|jgi:Xaa-Pro aminopeptidase|uniref:M24 family metallopeptidase n=1 Tax=Bifidobacterium tibiigranuli TaxID=2172043 RepID=UPI0026EB321B|nr:M24 family metallopeptidase [Bifidobacterium tibiigranuli]MCI1674167.1 M24 family metallopeptidase [Bifidobacterium tibiigranuli]MCI1712472.1 M24 family metallopeptidase [Bifidobacterium tibiigranuli]